MVEERQLGAARSRWGMRMIERLSRDDLLHVIDLSRACLAAGSYDDLRAVLGRLAAVAGCERVGIAAVAPGTEGRVAHHVDVSYGASWEELYVTRGLSRLDHVLHHARLVGGAFRWRDASSAPRNPLFFEAAHDHGLVDGITYSAPSRTSSEWTMLPLGTLAPPDEERGLVIASALGPHIHEAYARLRDRDRARPGAATGEQVALSAREREILAWIQDGKTYWEIGFILGISERTVKYHFARLQAKLGAVSRSHAVAKAMRLGLLG